MTWDRAPPSGEGRSCGGRACFPAADSLSLGENDKLEPGNYRYAPNPTARSTHEWVDTLMGSWPTLRSAIPSDVLDATVDPVPPAPNGYIHLEEQTGASMYLLDHGASHTRVFLDVQGSPHDTGEIIGTFRIMQGTTTPVALWVTTPEEEQDDHDYGGGEYDTKHFKRVRVCGPVNVTDPQPDGWYHKAQGPAGDIGKLQDLTIKNITKFLVTRT